MSSTPLLSIVTPAYNAAIFLPPLIAAISRAAKFCALEWVVIDDGSTDATVEIIRALTSANVTLNLIQQANAGLAVSRNRGLVAAQGEYLWFVDADDLILPEALSALMTTLADLPDMVGFQAMRFSGRGEDLATQPVYSQFHDNHMSTQMMTGEDWLTQQIKAKQWRHFAWIYLYRRQFLLDARLQFQPGILHEDIAFTTEATIRATKFFYVDVFAYQYRFNANSLTGSLNDVALQRRIDSYFVVVDQLRDINIRYANRLRTETLSLLKGEVIGQALQVFEVAKLLNDRKTRQQQYEKVCAMCRDRRFAQSLFKEVVSVKRLRQVMQIWLKQSGLHK